MTEKVRAELAAVAQLAGLSAGEWEAVANDSDADFPDVVESDMVVVGTRWVSTDGQGEAAPEDTIEAVVESWRDCAEPVDATTYWHVWAYRPAYALDEDGELAVGRYAERHLKVQVDPGEPKCESKSGHDWKSPLSVLGGCDSNPGVWGKGGGVVVREVCAHCGAYRTRDTWAHDPQTGEEGLESVSYESADDASEAWLARRDGRNVSIQVDVDATSLSDDDALDYSASGERFADLLTAAIQESYPRAEVVVTCEEDLESDVSVDAPGDAADEIRECCDHCSRVVHNGDGWVVALTEAE